VVLFRPMKWEKAKNDEFVEAGVFVTRGLLECGREVSRGGIADIPEYLGDGDSSVALCSLLSFLRLIRDHL
jgi:hypothetical protein